MHLTPYLTSVTDRFCENKLPFLAVRSSYRRCSVRKVVYQNFVKFTGKHLCQSLLLNKVADLRACNFIKKETLTQVFSCEFCRNFINTIFTEHLRVTVSEPLILRGFYLQLYSMKVIVTTAK